MAAVEKNIQVKIKALIEGMESVRQFQGALREIEKQGGKRFNLNARETTEDAGKLANVLRLISPRAAAATDQVETLTESLGGSAGLAGALGAVTGLLAVAAGLEILVVGGLFKLAESAAKAGARFHNLSIETGLSVETLSGLELQLRQANASVEDLSSAAFDMQKNLASAAAGNKELRRTFEQLGIKDAREAMRNTDATLRTLLQNLAKIPDEGTRNAVGAQVMGKAYKQLRVFIKETNGDIEKTIERAREAGLVMSKDAARAADEFGDQLDELKLRASRFATTLGGQLVPEFVRAFRVLNSEATASGGVLTFVFSSIAQKIRQATTEALFLIAAVKAAPYGVLGLIGTVTSNPALAQVGKNLAKSKFQKSLADIVGASVTEAPKDEPSLPDFDFGGAPKGGGGGGTSRKERMRQILRELVQAQLDLKKQLLDEDFTLTKDALDRELDHLKESQEQRLVSIRDFYAETLRIKTAAIAAEIEKLEGEFDLSIQRRDNAIAEIKGDRELSPAERRKKIEIEANKFAAEYSKIQSQIAIKEREREEIKVRTNREERLATEELEKQLKALRDQRDALIGDPVEAVKTETKERFKPLRETLNRELAQAKRLFGEASPEAEKFVKALQEVDEVSTLIVRKAQFDELGDQLRHVFDLLSNAESAIDRDQLLEGFSDEEVARRRVEAGRRLRVELEKIHGEMKAIAEVTKDPEMLAAAERLAIEISKIGVQVDEVGRSINAEIRQGLKDTLASIITDTRNAGEHLVNLARQILDRISAMIADRLVESIFGPGGLLDGLLGGRGQQGSAGGVGGWLSKILGFPGAQGGGSQSGGGSSQQTIANIPGVIKNFQASATSGLARIGATTGDVRNETRDGFARVLGTFGRANELLAEIRNNSAIQAGIQTASFITGILKGIFSSGGQQGFAAGGGVAARPGGRLIQVAEGGFDELVVTTDPRHSARTAVLLGQFIRRTGIAPDFGLKNLSARLRSSISHRIPQLAAGAFIEALPTPALAEGEVNLYQTNNFHYHGTGGARPSEQQVARDMARAAQQGLGRARRR